MKFFSKTGLIFSVAVLVMGVASAKKADSIEKNASIPADSKSYTASGSTDIQTAKMLVNLLRNPHLKVKAEVHKAAQNKIQLPQNANDPVYTAHGKTDKKTAQMLINLLRNPYLKVKAEVHPSNNRNNVKYIIKGKTSVANIKKLQALLKSNKHINITVQANNKSSSSINLKARTQPAVQQYIYQDYSAIIARGLPFYHRGRPPVFIRGNTLWYPVAITSQPPSGQQVQKVSE